MLPQPVGGLRNANTANTAKQLCQLLSASISSADFRQHLNFQLSNFQLCISLLDLISPHDDSCLLACLISFISNHPLSSNRDPKTRSPFLYLTEILIAQPILQNNRLPESACGFGCTIRAPFSSHGGTHARTGIRVCSHWELPFVTMEEKSEKPRGGGLTGENFVSAQQPNIGKQF